MRSSRTVKWKRENKINLSSFQLCCWIFSIKHSRKKVNKEEERPTVIQKSAKNNIEIDYLKGIIISWEINIQSCKESSKEMSNIYPEQQPIWLYFLHTEEIQCALDSYMVKVSCGIGAPQSEESSHKKSNRVSCTAK